MYRKLTADLTHPSSRTIKFPESQEQFSPNIIKTSHYTWHNFIFLNLFEQFHRFANIFFLFLAIIQAIPSISPLNQLAGFVQLTFMLSITAVKNAYEDFLRHKTDKEVNDRLSPVYTHQTNQYRTSTDKNDKNDFLLDDFDDQYQFKKWSELRVSDVVRIDPNSEAPADCLLIEALSGDNKCRIETSALDGETFLKFRYPLFQSDMNKTQTLTKDDTFVIQVSPPTPNLKIFSGKLVKSDNETIPISNMNFIPRGCINRDQKPFLAIVVYTGDDTKLMMNSMKPRFKFTELDRIMSRMAFVLLLAMFAICFVMTILGKIWKDNKLNPSNNRVDGYLKLALDDNQAWFLQFFSWIIDLQMIIPLAVYSSLDVVRFLLSFNISFDEKMCGEFRHDSGNRGDDFDYSYSRIQNLNQNDNVFTESLQKKSKCHNSDLVSTIGRVTHVFTDKTGTLTKNIMTFRSASFSDFEFNTENKSNTESSEKVGNNKEVDFDFFVENSIDNQDIWHFLTTIILCNSVDVIDHKYMSNSPDELALLEFAKECQFELLDNLDNKVAVKIKGEFVEIERPIRFDFNSKRKRSSVICKINGQWVMLVKGADSVIVPRCNNYSSKHKERLDKLGERGFRTLCFAYKNLSEKMVNSLIEEYQQKMSLPVGSEEAIDELAESVEADLTIFGFSGVEDELQEDVGKTLDQVRQANVQVWMLTGDRLETAINIGKNCGLISHTDSIITVKRCKKSGYDASDLNSDSVELYYNDQLLSNFESSGIEIDIENSVLCSDDADAILNDIGLFSLAFRCSSVVVARCEPLQKGNAVRLFKENVKALENMNRSSNTMKELNPLSVKSIETKSSSENRCSSLKDCCCFYSNPVVLAIGDGVNDVDMIRAADVGVAVEGREGSAAVLSSDFSILTFSMLSRLLIVHGRFNCIRTSLLVLVTFYKNLLLGLPQMIYGFYNGFSATSSFDSGFFAMYNVILTIPQHFLACVIEEDVDENVCLSNPSVYRDYQKNGGFDFFNIFWFYFISVVHSLLIYYIPYFSFNLTVLNDQFATFDHSLFTQILGWSLMSVFTYEMFHIFHSLSLFQAIVNIACFLSNFAIQYFYSFVEGEYDSMLYRSGKACQMWISIPLIVGICIVIDLIKDFIRPMIKVTYTDLVIRNA